MLYQKRTKIVIRRKSWVFSIVTNEKILKVWTSLRTAHRHLVLVALTKTPLCWKRNVILLIRYILTHLRKEPCLVWSVFCPFLRLFLMWLQNEGNTLNANSSLVILLVLWNCCCLHRSVYSGQKLKNLQPIS